MLIVYSRAFAGQSQHLTPIPALTHIGTYSESGPETSVQAMEAEAAQPYTGIPRVSPPEPAKGGGGKTMLIIGVAALILIIIWWLLA